MGDFKDLPTAEPVRKVRTRTVLVQAIENPPWGLGFRVGGRRVEIGEKVRVPAVDAQDLLRRGKCKIIEGTEETQLL